MRSRTLAFALIAASATFGVVSAGRAADPAPAAKPHAAMAMKPAKGGDGALIASAMSAAPMALSKSATIAQMQADGSLRVLRKGTNGFTCIPDDTTTPGPDPMCFDQNAGEFIMALGGHKPPPEKTGLMYMLAGGTDASNTDPYAAKPTDKNHWIKTGPHLMIVGNPEMLKGYPASPDPNTASPYVMWAGTPYAHLMAPVK